MKQIIIFIGFATTLTSCITSSVTILENKEISRPFSKLLLIYVDKDCNLQLLDPASYNNYIKSNFSDTGNFDSTTISENLFYNKLSLSRTIFIRSSDLFNAGINDYKSFISEINKLKIDGILLISRAGSHHRLTNRGSFDGLYDPITESRSVPAAYALDDEYKYYLLRSDSGTTVWIAQFDIKGNEHSTIASLRNYMANKLPKTINTDNYLEKK